ncbi:UDP-glucose 4-epimerase GalE [Roseibium sp. Sym1]|uniref:UDP-glucose 4-epimerase GalE n=1 Tax=Roseibium sp. Sym1 TaxID=3016006 RepID=UPI0022B2BB7E|nr:UDP-glucose 4-epimerase GalE [Roseibium sp. Sym1]
MQCDNRTVLVAGGAGYIGAHACKALKQAGYTPVVYDNLVTGHRYAVKWGAFEHGDILDRRRLDEVMRKHAPGAVLHFAAYAYVGESVEDPGKYHRNNVAGSLSLLEACRDHGIPHFVFSSSCAVYGVPEQVPINEQTPSCPINPYGWTKFHVEQMLKDFSAAHDLSFMALRYFNAAGADPEAEIGEDHDPETRIIPLAIRASEPSGQVFKVFGTDYDTPDGTCIRDYIHVSDLADAHVRALQALQDGGGSACLNLGTGEGASVLQVARAVEDVTGRDVRLEFAERRPGDPAVLVADAGRAKERLGWQPRFRDLADIVRTAYRWHGTK